ncbi:N-acetylglucosaminyl-diphospho-decaprenol L-rhamnosyltransferase [Streptacidiphilus sp. MAP12-16]|uniref:glycosyltransferase family 2 protein n=1 Tax=Streptacidiphilus sp. MAP12-16 TaxID=3156300 RepID=UPI003514526A
MLDVVIVNWNTGDRLQACLRSIERSDRSVLPVDQVVVVDNASHDGSAEGLELPSLRVTTVHNRRNLGFAAACNQGAAHCSGTYLLFLNPDTELYPDTLRTVGEFMRTQEAAVVGICGGRMLDERGQPGISCSRFPTLTSYIGTMTGLDRALPAVFPPHHLAAAELTGSGAVDQVIGAFSLVRRSLFDDLGGFDERFFLYQEDVDFALRARRRGWLSYYLSDARVQHIGNVSSDQIRGLRLSYSLCSRSLFAFHHWPRWKASLLVALTLSVELTARVARAVLRGSRAEVRDTATGYRDYLRWLLRSMPSAYRGSDPWTASAA